MAAAWSLRVSARRGIRRVLRAAGGVDLVHLRMADVGSLAAADVASELDIPIVFTVAPDPHAVIQSLDLAGRLTRQNFGEVDAAEHFWFRARLVQRLAANAAHTVLFPRPALRARHARAGRDRRHWRTRSGTRSCRRAWTSSSSTAPWRRRRRTPRAASRPTRWPSCAPWSTRCRASAGALPLIVSVGRLHRVKGVATLVQAWAGGGLRDRANLLVVGGDLEHPSADEREQLDLIDAVVPAAGRAAAGLLLPGHRPNDVVARWVAAARTGLPGRSAPRGIYVCASLKEEFGIALLEAMASGLVVVAPDGGGPATYVDEGDTGFLTATWHADRLARGDRVRARRLARRDGRPACGPVPRDRRPELHHPAHGRHARRPLPTGRGGRARGPVGAGRPRMTLLDHQPGLRLAPAPAGRPGHGVAGRGGARGRAPAARPPRASRPRSATRRRPCSWAAGPTRG